MEIKKKGKKVSFVHFFQLSVPFSPSRNLRWPCGGPIFRFYILVGEDEGGKVILVILLKWVAEIALFYFRNLRTNAVDVR